MNSTLYIIIACDTDPDRSNFIRGISSTNLSWRGMLEGIPRAKAKLAGLVDDEKKSPVFTWLLRADYQIRKLYGKFNHILKAHRDFFLSLEKDGDELGWHPHFWYLPESGNSWMQNYEDIGWQTKMLEDAYFDFQEILPGRANSVRMGWTYHNNNTMAKLSDLSIKVDLSSIPGVRIDPGGRRGSANYYDWEKSPRTPYHPSVTDYRRPGLPGEHGLPILVVPNYTVKSLLWGIFSGVVLAKKMRDTNQLKRALINRTYIATITSNPKLFGPVLRQLARDLGSGGDVFYLTPLHPDELVQNSHPVYSLENMESNLKSIFGVARKSNARVKYTRAIDAADIVQVN